MEIDDRPDNERITPAMLLAGVKAYLEWNEGKEDAEAMVAAVYYSMIDARVSFQTHSE